MNNLTEMVLTIAVAIIGLATVAVLVGRQARTSEVIGAASQGFIGSLATAISPVTGGGSGFNPSANFGGSGNMRLF